MPQAIVAVKAFMALSTAAKLVVVGKFLLTTTLVAAASYGLARLVAKKPSTGGNALNSGASLDMTIESDTPRRVVYGERRVGGAVRLKHITGANNQFLYIIYVLAGHPCEAISDIRFGDEIVPLDGSGNATGTYAGYCRITKHLGATDQAADANFVAELGSVWTTDHRLRGCAYLAIRLTWNQDKFPGGLPVITAVVKGKNNILDTRTSTTGWSDNPGMCLRDYLLDQQIGLQGTTDDLIEDSFIATANGCDEEVALAGGGTEKRYTINGSFETSVTPTQVVEAMCDAMAGKIYDIGGQVYVRPGVWETPDFDLTEDMLRGGVSSTSPLSIREKYNAVKGTFDDPAELWNRTDFPAVVSDAFAEIDGRELMADIDLSFVNSATRCQRIAKIALLRTRQGIIADFPCNLRAIPAQPGKNIRVTNTKRTWTNKHFEVLEFGFGTERGNDGGLGFVTNVVGQETHSSIYDWTTDEEDTTDPAPNTGTYDPRVVGAPTGLTLALATLAERTALPRIKITWDLPADAFITSGGFTEIEFKKNAEATWQPWNRVLGSLAIDYLNDVDVGTNTDVRIRHINVHGVPGDWSATASIVAAAGTGTYTALLTNEAHSVSCAADGTPISGELGSGGRAKTTVLAYAGSVALTAVASSPAAGQFSFTIATLSGTGTWTKESDSIARADSLSTDSVIARLTIDLEGLLTVTKDWTLSKVTSGNDGDDGTDGDDATVYWLLPDAAAIKKSEAGAYTPATLNLSAFTRTGAGAASAYAGRFIIATFNGSTWTDQYTSSGNESTKAYTVPASIQAIRSRLYLAGGTSTLLDEQIVPIVLDGATGATGAAGAAGLNNATVYIYRRAASSPTLPSATTTYTFSTGVLASLNNSWTQAVPATDSNPLWVSVATASNAGSTDTIASGEWASPVLLVEDGADGASGADGLNVASVFLFKRAASTPSVPSTTATYTFSTGVLTGHNNGWTQAVPTSDGNPLYVTTATAASTSSTDTIATGEWASPTIMAQDGAAGAPGNTYSVTINLHPSGLGAGSINGTGISGTSGTVTGITAGAVVTIAADSNVSGDSWLGWAGSWPDIDQVENTGSNPTSLLVTKNITLTANY